MIFTPTKMDWILSSHLDTLHNNVQQALPRLEQYSVCCVSCWFNDCISHRNCKLSWNTAVTNMYGFCTISNNNTFITFSADRSNAVPLLHLSLSLSLSLSVCLSLSLYVGYCNRAVSSSWGLGWAAVCDCGTPWTFLLPFLQ